MQRPRQQVSQHGGLSPRVGGVLWDLQEVFYKVPGVLQEVLWILKILLLQEQVHQEPSSQIKFLASFWAPVVPEEV